MITEANWKSGSIYGTPCMHSHFRSFWFISSIFLFHKISQIFIIIVGFDDITFCCERIHCAMNCAALGFLSLSSSSLSPIFPSPEQNGRSSMSTLATYWNHFHFRWPLHYFGDRTKSSILKIQSRNLVQSCPFQLTLAWPLARSMQSCINAIAACLKTRAFGSVQ